MCPIDKAGSDIAFIWNEFYLESIGKELENTPTYEEVVMNVGPKLFRNTLNFVKD